MQFLISAPVAHAGGQEAQASPPADEEVQKSFDAAEKQSFPKEADYQKFLQSSGMTEADLLFRVKLDVLTSRCAQKIDQGNAKVSDAADPGLLQQEQGSASRSPSAVICSSC